MCSLRGLLSLSSESLTDFGSGVTVLSLVEEIAVVEVSIALLLLFEVGYE